MDSSPADSAPSTDELDTALRALIGRGRFMAPPQRKRLHDMATQANKSIKPFPFLDLPPELRNRIYELVLLSSSETFPMLPSLCTHKTRIHAIQPALSKVNHQIRDESLSIFYSSNDFDIHIHRCDFTYLISWLDSIGPKNRTHLRKIWLTLKDRWTCAEGLLDFFRWCVHSTGTEKLVFHVDVTEWNEENLDMGQYKDINEPGCAMYETSEMLLGVIELAKNTAKSGKFTEARIRRDFTLWVGEEEYECRKNRCEMTTTSVSRVEAGYCTIVNGRANCDDNLCKSCPLDKKHRAILKAMQHQEGGCQSCGSDSTTTYERCDDCGEEWETSET